MALNDQINFLIALCLSILSGILIGMERESRGKDAGISTHVFVILGAMLFTFISKLVDSDSSARIAAQIVSGIGFLGAGLIIKDGSNVKNLTTAANLWFAGAIGMAFGFELYLIGIVSALVSIFIPKIPHVNKKHIE